MLDVTGIAWNDVWNEQIMKRRKCTVGSSELWSNAKDAKNFFNFFQNRHNNRIEQIISRLDLSPECRILDIGAGPGAIALPIHDKVQHITAVEPSPGMVKVLKKKISKHAARNIDCIEKYWEDVDIHKDLDQPYHIVMAVNAIDMLDIKSAIDKMIRVTNRYVYLFWFASNPKRESYFKTIWPTLHGIDFHGTPKANILLNLLHQMGIYPNTEVFQTNNGFVFNSMDEAVGMLSPLYLASSDDQKRILRDFLETILEKKDNAYLYNDSYLAIKIYWDKWQVGHM